MNNLQEEIADHMSREARHTILRKLSDRITTEDLEIIYNRRPAALDEALHEILNSQPLPDVDTIRHLLRVDTADQVIGSFIFPRAEGNLIDGLQKRVQAVCEK